MFQSHLQLDLQCSASESSASGQIDITMFDLSLVFVLHGVTLTIVFIGTRALEG